MSYRILRLPVVLDRTQRSRTAIYEAIARKEFPQPVKLGVRSVGWIEEEIDAWLEARKAQREAA